MKPEMLAAAHWGYVESVLQLHGEQLDVIEKCGEHYKAAFVHGFKHGIESLSENSADKGSKIAVTRIYGARGTSHAQTENQGRLNPAFSRWLMGFPKAWCEAAIEAWRQMPINRRKRAPCD